MIEHFYRIFRLTTLKSRIYFWIIVTYLLLVVTSILIFSSFSYNKIRDDHMQSLQNSLSIQQQYVDHWLSDRLNDFRYLADNEVLLTDDYEKKHHTLKNFHEHHPHTQGAGFVNKHGITKIVMNQDNLGLDVSDRDYFEKARQGKAHISDVLISRTYHKPSLIITAPVLDKKNQFHGLVLGGVFLETIDQVMHNYPHHKTGNTYIVDKNNRLISSVRFGQEHDGPLPAYGTKIHTPLLAAARVGTTPENPYRSYYDMLVFGTYTTANQGRWILVGEVERSEIVRELTEELSIFISCAFILFVLLLIMMKYLTKKIYRPLSHLSRGSEALHKGDYDFQIDPDVIRRLPVEFQQPCLTFNQMAETTRNNIRALEETDLKLRNSEKLNVIGELAAGIAHEIRNPLTALKGFVQMLEADKSFPKKQYMKIMHSEIDRINFIVNEFMVLAKPQAVQFGKKDLIATLRDVLLILDTQAILNNVVIETEFEEIPLIYCQEDQMKQVFINILKNSIEAMPEGGTIRVQAYPCDLTHVAVRITDQGSGIPESNLAKLGQPFFTTKDDGTGLGLMVSQKIIQNHQGRMEISSEVGKGTTIEIILPHTPDDITPE